MRRRFSIFDSATLPENGTVRSKPICVFRSPLWQDGVYGQTAPSASYPDLEGGTHSQAFSSKESTAGKAIQEIQTVGCIRKIRPRGFWRCMHPCSRVTRKCHSHFS